MSPRIHLNTRLLPILLGVVLLMQLIQPYKGWAILLVGLGLFWLACLLWARALSKNLGVTREMRYGWAQVGDELEERFTLYNLGWVPGLWVEVIDGSNMPDYYASRVTGVEGNSKNSWRMHGLCKRRGIFTLGPTRLRSGDPFGIYHVDIPGTASTTLTVMPPIVPLPAIEIAPGGKAGEGQPRSDAPERTVSAATVREYMPGDSLHLIHWRTTARMGFPFVRIFDGTPAGDWWIFLDMDRRWQAGQGWDATEEHGVILAASLADRGMRLRRAIGLVSNGDQLVWLPPQEGSRGAARRMEIMRALALLNPGDYSLADLLKRSRPSIGKRTSLILITPNTGLDWVEALVPLLWKGVIPTVLLLDPVTFGGQGDAHAILSALSEMGVGRYLITRDLLDRPEARPGHEGHFEWRVTPRGRAVAIRKPSNTAWKVLS